MDSTTLIGLGVALILALYNSSKPKKDNKKPEGDIPKNRNPFDFLKEIQAKLEEQERENQRKAIEQKNKAENYRNTKPSLKTPKPQVQANYQKSSKPVNYERDIEQEELVKANDRNSLENYSSAYSEKHSIMQLERDKADKIRFDDEEKKLFVNPYLEILSDASELKKAIIYKEILDRKEY